MIDTRELRIGNIVEWTHIYLENKIVKVQSVIGGQVAVYDYQSENVFDVFTSIRNYIKPVPITEEWLKCFGFLYEQGAWKVESFCVLHEYEDVFFIELQYPNQYQNYSPMYVRREVEYVHDLQNIHFALTGKELEVTQ